MIEDILYLEIVMDSVDSIFSFLKKTWKKEKRLTGYLKKYNFKDIAPKILQINSQSHHS